MLRVAFVLRSTEVIPVFFDLFTPSTLNAFQMFFFEECLITFLNTTHNKTSFPGAKQTQQKRCIAFVSANTFTIAFTLFHRCLVLLPSLNHGLQPWPSTIAFTIAFTIALIIAFTIAFTIAPLRLYLCFLICSDIQPLTLFKYFFLKSA